jgi:hypothetical protein
VEDRFDHVVLSDSEKPKLATEELVKQASYLDANAEWNKLGNGSLKALDTHLVDWHLVDYKSSTDATVSKVNENMDDLNNALAKVNTKIALSKTVNYVSSS